MVGAVAKSDDEDSARTLPGLFGFPGVAVTLTRRVVGEAAAAGIDGFFDIVSGCIRITGNLAKRWISRREDVHSLITAQTRISTESPVQQSRH